MSGKTKAQLQAELDAANKKIDKMEDVVYDARKARRAVQNKVNNLSWEEAQSKAKGDAYKDTADRFQAVLNDWTKN